jgi:hypothetical protein
MGSSWFIVGSFVVSVVAETVFAEVACDPLGADMERWFQAVDGAGRATAAATGGEPGGDGGGGAAGAQAREITRR